MEFEVEEANESPSEKYKEIAKEELSITLSFTVTETGDLSDIEVVETNAPNKLNNLLSRVLRKTYYRPAFENGRPVATPGVTLKQTFTPRAPRDTTEP